MGYYVYPKAPGQEELQLSWVEGLIRWALCPNGLTGENELLEVQKAEGAVEEKDLPFLYNGWTYGLRPQTAAGAQEIARRLREAHARRTILRCSVCGVGEGFGYPCFQGGQDTHMSVEDSWQRVVELATWLEASGGFRIE